MLKYLATGIVVVLGLAPLVYGGQVHYDLVVGNAVASPDGFERKRTLQFPGPLITAKRGDIITVNVKNELSNTNMRASTSINWSGLLQLGHPEFDGTSFVTQCPIAPNTSFTYTIDTGSQAGTFLYRSGLGIQYVDGLRGPLIIYDPKDPHLHLYDVDNNSTIFQLGEWYHGFSTDDFAIFQATGSIPIYDAGLINGVGRMQGGPEVPFGVFNVVSGTRYRLRLISNAPRAVFGFFIDQHNLTVIEEDGISTEPVEVEGLELYRQRYSVVFAADQPVGNYWLRSFPRGGTQTKNPNLNATLSRAIVRYAGAPFEDPTTPQANITLLKETQLHPLINPGSPGGPDAEPDVNITLNFTTENPLDTWRVNDIAYKDPSIPTLTQIMNNNDTFPEDSHIIVLPTNALVQMVMPLGEDGGGHPMHIHGTTFDVIQPGDSGGVKNFINPSRRDVIPVIGDTTIVRFRTPAVGAHIIWHAEAGLQMTLISDPSVVRDTVRPSREWNNLCDEYNSLAAEFQ
ncbi:Cu-oxidase-domain-containing protein [Armillaria luteobubalina]|uniref:Cu-oxidase-domain-containing protein n=1 Tax=Armillaria luteobubalina TaxID=153913 RepID=A0AA39URP4_9AGAR|nr:Cu-oxidase-domain-containing protein [Armillaria luteobubalina]